MPDTASFAARYGPVALVAGASEGLGAAFADALASRGLDLVLVARRSGPLEATAAALRDRHRVRVDTRALDLAGDGVVTTLQNLVLAHEIGLVVYNAAYAPVGPMLEQDPGDLLRAVDVNVRGPLLVVRALAPAMKRRGHGGVVLMSSLAGNQGTPRVATYAATKAFNTVLAEGLWDELRGDGLDVVVSCAGAIATPGYAQAASAAKRPAPGTLPPETVASQTLDALGRGPRVTPGWLNRIAGFVIGRLLPRRWAVAVMAASTRSLS